MPPHIAIGLTEQILGALGYAHRQGIVHRDVKPQNVILDPEGQAKVADFGIARAGNSEMTQTGAMIGTVQYLSPEQANGYPVDPPLGSLLDRDRALRAADRARAVRGRGADLDRAQARQRAARPARPAAPRHLAGARGRGHARAREGPEPALPERRGVHRRARAGAPRARGPAAGRGARRRADRGARARSRWWVWALVALAVAALAVGAYFLLAGNRVTVPNLVGRDAEEVADILQERGLEPDFEDVVNDDVKRDEVISQNPEAGSEVREGTVVEVRVSAGPGTTAVPDVVGGEEEAAEQALRGRGLQDQGRARVLRHRARGHRHQHVGPGRAPGDQGPHDHAHRQPRAGARHRPGRGGQHAARARTMCSRPPGWAPKITEQESSEPPGTVLEQNPAEGDEPPAGRRPSTSSWPRSARRSPTCPRATRRSKRPRRRSRRPATRSRRPTGRRPIRTWSGA